MEFHHDFLKPHSKSGFLTAAGVFLLLTSLYLMVFDSSREFSGVGLTNLLLGITMLGRGIGYPLEYLLGKQFISVDANSIIMKRKLLRREQCILWSKMQKLELWPGYFSITTTDGNSHKTDIKDLEPAVRHNFLMSLIKQSEEKHISCIRHGYLSQIG